MQADKLRAYAPLMAVVAIFVVIGVIWVATHQGTGVSGNGGFSANSRSNLFPAETELNRDARTQVPLQDMPNSGLAGPGSIPMSPSGESSEAARAREAVQKATQRLGLPPPGGSSSDGRVHLRSGDSISQEQYDEVQRKLRSNPIFGNGGSVPRL